MADFSEKLVTVLNHGALNLAIGMGYALKIFDVMDDAGRALTIKELSGLSGLDRRYLEEWMGIMVTGGIIDPDSETPEAYFFPREHGDLLCRRAGANNLGVYCQEIPLLTSCAMEGVMRGFSTGDGVPFSQYPKFQSFMTELADAKHQSVLVKEFLPSVDQGRLQERLLTGIRVMDLGCGQGTAVHLMAQAFPASEFTGIDSHGPAVEQAARTAKEKGLENAKFLKRDAAGLNLDNGFKEKFHWICAFDAIHDQSRPLNALEAARDLLLPDGMFSMIDIKAESGIRDNCSHPMAPFLYTVSLMHCMPVGLNDKGTGLGMMWGRQKARALLEQAGFSHILEEEIPNDAFNLHFLCRP